MPLWQYLLLLLWLSPPLFHCTIVGDEPPTTTENVDVLLEGSFAGENNFTVEGRVEIIRLQIESDDANGNGDEMDPEFHLQLSPQFRIVQPNGSNIAEFSIYLSKGATLTSQVRIATIPANLSGYHRYRIVNQNAIDNINDYIHVLLYAESTDTIVGSAELNYSPSNNSEVTSLLEGSFSGENNFTVEGKVQIVRLLADSDDMEERLYLELNSDFSIVQPNGSQITEFSIYISQGATPTSQVRIATIPAEVAGRHRYPIDEDAIGSIANINDYIYVLLYAAIIDSSDTLIGNAELTHSFSNNHEVTSLLEGSFSGENNFTVEGGVQIIRLSADSDDMEERLYLELNSDFRIVQPSGNSQGNQITEFSIYLSQGATLTSQVEIATIPAEVAGRHRYRIASQNANAIDIINDYTHILLYAAVDGSDTLIGSAELKIVLLQGSFSGANSFAVAGGVEIFRLPNESMGTQLYIELDSEFGIVQPTTGSQITEFSIYLSQGATLTSPVRIATIPADLAGRHRYRIDEDATNSIDSINDYIYLLLNAAVDGSATLIGSAEVDPPPNRIEATALLEDSFSGENGFTVAGGVEIIRLSAESDDMEERLYLELDSEFGIVQPTGNGQSNDIAEFSIYLSQGATLTSQVKIATIPAEVAGRHRYRIADQNAIDHINDYTHILLYVESTATIIGSAGMDMIDPPDEEETLLYTGAFASIGGYTVEGTANIVQNSEGERTLKLLSDFSSSRGPGVYVYLTQAAGHPTPLDINFGEIKSFSGEQSYAIGEGVNLFGYSYVLIYCKPFGVPFGRAAIAPP